jgi:hypothetical protein
MKRWENFDLDEMVDLLTGLESIAYDTANIRCLISELRSEISERSRS